MPQKIAPKDMTLKSAKPTRLSDYTGNTLQISPEQAIEDFCEHLKENPEFDKVFLIALRTKGGYFDVNWFRGRMLISEALAALDIAKDDLLRGLRGEGV